MDKKRLELIGSVALAVVFIVILTNSFMRAKRKAPSIKKRASAESAPALKAESLFRMKREKVEKEIVEKSLLGWGRDPFILQASGQGDEGTVIGLKLMGITVAEKAKSMAIINDKIVSVDSKIGKFTVLKISPDKVIVSDGEKSYELKMKR